MPNFLEKLRVGTRGSPLALAQVSSVQKKIQEKFPKVKFEIKIIQTSGDRFAGERLAEAGGKGLFAKEIEDALIGGQIDFAVHSLKDLPGILPDTLMLAAFPLREDPRDVLVSDKFSSLESLPRGTKVATSSPRREAQLKALRPDLCVKPMRGNIDTRLKKMADGNCDAMILAAAGLHRLQKREVIRQYFETDFFLPAIGQGVLGIEARRLDFEWCQKLRQALEDADTAVAARAERSFLQGVGGDCYSPVAAHAWVKNHRLHMMGWVGSPDGSETVRMEKTGGMDNPEVLGQELAMELLQKGGRKILDAIAAHTTP